MQAVLGVGGPEDGAVEDAAVLKGIGQAAEIDATPFPIGVDRHLDLPVPLDQNLRALQGVNALLALTEVHILGTVGEDEVVPVLLPVILIKAQGEPGLLLHAQGAGQL